MGWEHATILINVHLDTHGDDRQTRDKQLWEELKEEILKVIKQAKFRPIAPSL